MFLSSLFCFLREFTLNELIDSDDFDETLVRHHGMGEGAFTVAFQPFDKLGVWGLGSAILRYPVLHGV